MITTTYRGPSVKATRKGMCPTCRKPATRTATFEATVNPYNRRPDGVPKTWAEVLVDVRARADEWQPEPEEFEHQKCAAARLAPEPAEPAKVSTVRAAATAGFRTAVRTVVDFTADHSLPLTSMDLTRDGTETAPYRVFIGFIPSTEIVMWARAFGLASANVDDGGHCIYIRLRHDTDQIRWRVDACVSKPSIGDPLGGAAVTWSRDRNSRKNGYGTVTIDELEAGLLRAGTAVAVAS